MPDDAAEVAADIGAALDAALVGHSALVYGLVLGHDTGLLEAFSAGPTTATALAEQSGADPRLTLEWLRVMVVSGFADHDEGIFRPRQGLDHVVHVPGVGSRAEIISLRTHRLDEMLTLLSEAVRNGGGVPHAAYEPIASRSQDMFNLTTASAHLVPDILTPIPGVAAVLSAGGSLLDLGCGGGWALAAIVEAFPRAPLTGFDLDEHALSIAAGRLEGLGARAHLEARDVSDLPRDAFDVILAVDTIHDLGDPSATLAAVAAALRAGGVFVMAESAATGDFETDRHSDARFEYYSSLAMCIPVSQAAGGPGLGALWGRTAALPMLADAGFTEVSVHSAPPGFDVYAARVVSGAAPADGPTAPSN